MPEWNKYGNIFKKKSKLRKYLKIDKKNKNDEPRKLYKYILHKNTGEKPP